MILLADEQLVCLKFAETDNDWNKKLAIRLKSAPTMLPKFSLLRLIPLQKLHTLR